MEKDQEEITSKIKTAIKQRLRDMNVLIDEELPDYILILIANKRSKEHISEDLSLFLGVESVEFTEWLFDFKKSLSNPSVNEIDNSKSEKSRNGSLSVKHEEITMKTVVGMESGTRATKITLKSGFHKNIRGFPRSSVVTVVNNANNSDEEPAQSVSSVVRVTERKYNVPAAVKANKLLLRAVNEATKSVMEDKDEDNYKPTPIKTLSSTTKVAVVPSDPDPKQPPVQRTSSFSSDWNQDITNQQVDLREVLRAQRNNVMKTVNFHGTLSNPISDVALEKKVASDDLRQSITPRKRSFENMELMTELGTQYLPKMQKVESSIDSDLPQDEDPKAPISPHFIVTLNGVNLKSAKQRLILEDMDIDDTESLLEEDAKPEDKKERCKFWPSCTNNLCIYHHPTVPCKLFPNCKFGDKCLYVHPNCKFDVYCTKLNCPFIHKNVPFASGKKKPAMCKFFPGCTSKSCTFYHPKSCKFGRNCQTYKCPFSHLPSKDLLTWKADVAE